MNIPVIRSAETSPRALDGKVALVTGSTSGIGLGVARALAQAGAQIALNGFGTPEDIAAERHRIETESGVQAVHLGADMSKPPEIEAMMARALEEFGRLDVLVNNAGIQHVARVDEFPVDKWGDPRDQ